jgi:Fe-S oxidoreductase
VLKLLDSAPSDLWREPAEPLSVLIHPHCHARALGVGSMTRDLLQRVPGVRVRETGAGCCGMAGAFGYEAATAELSRRIAEDRFLPAVRGLQPGEHFVAHGFSCRSQASDLAGVKARHPLEIVAERVRS